MVEGQRMTIAQVKTKITQVKTKKKLKNELDKWVNDFKQLNNRDPRRKEVPNEILEMLRRYKRLKDMHHEERVKKAREEDMLLEKPVLEKMLESNVKKAAEDEKVLRLNSETLKHEEQIYRDENDDDNDVFIAGVGETGKRGVTFRQKNVEKFSHDPRQNDKIYYYDVLDIKEKIDNMDWSNLRMLMQEISDNWPDKLVEFINTIYEEKNGKDFVPYTITNKKPPLKPVTRKSAPRVVKITVDIDDVDPNEQTTYSEWSRPPTEETSNDTYTPFEAFEIEKEINLSDEYTKEDWLNYSRKDAADIILLLLEIAISEKHIKISNMDEVEEEEKEMAALKRKEDEDKDTLDKPVRGGRRTPARLNAPHDNVTQKKGGGKRRKTRHRKGRRSKKGVARKTRKNKKKTHRCRRLEKNRKKR